MEETTTHRETMRISTYAIVIACILTVSSFSMMAAYAESDAGIPEVEDTDQYRNSILEDYSHDEVLAAHLWLIENANNISFHLDDDGNIIAEIDDPLPFFKAGRTGVDTYREGIIIHLDSDLCDTLYGYGSTIAGAALMGALGAALGSAIPALGTAAGGVSMSIIGGIVTKALFDYIDNRLDYSSGVDVEVKLIGYAFGIPYPWPPQVKSITSQ